VARRRSANSPGDAARGPALARLILDTTILIDAERGAAELDELIADEDDVSIAAITAAELMLGVELADKRRRRARERYVHDVLATIPVESYDLEAAQAHATLLAHTHRTGRARSAHDLIIAATALARERIVVTADSRGFVDLPGIEIRAASR
jgi:tRNA(fMet)-specific endonuclease VapC